MTLIFGRSGFRQRSYIKRLLPLLLLLAILMPVAAFAAPLHLAPANAAATAATPPAPFAAGFPST